MAIRTEDGYKTRGTTKIKAVDRKNEILLSWQDDGTGTAEISTSEVITTTNKIFYVIATSYSLTAGRDTSPVIQVDYNVVEA